jgi:hypothetical protein
MLERLKDWFIDRFSDGGRKAVAAPRSPRPPARPTPLQKVPRRTPDYVDADDDLSGEIESQGPGKNVLIRNKFVREDTGTHETLKILDDSLVDSGEEPGIDPYNTGEFDRSKHWDRRFGK